MLHRHFSPTKSLKTLFLFWGEWNFMSKYRSSASSYSINCNKALQPLSSQITLIQCQFPATAANISIPSTSSFKPLTGSSTALRTLIFSRSYMTNGVWVKFQLFTSRFNSTVHLRRHFTKKTQHLQPYPMWGQGVLYAKQLVRRYFVILKVCSLNREGMGGWNKRDLWIRRSTAWSSPECSSECQSCVLYASTEALTELWDISKGLMHPCRSGELKNQESPTKAHRMISKSQASFPSPPYISEGCYVHRLRYIMEWVNYRII